MEAQVISWNLTRRCNLECAHCYLPSADKLTGGAEELSTQECFRVIDQIAQVVVNPMLILTGGEPLLRPDIFEIAHYASRKNMTVVVGTNGMGMTERLAHRLMESGVQGVGVSLDSLNPSFHDSFRGVPGAWERTVKGLEALNRVGLPFIIQTTVLKGNYHEMPEIADFSYRSGARVFNIYFLVCTGRGQGLTDITPEQYEEMLKKIVDMEIGYRGKMLVRAKCAPHFHRVLYEREGLSETLKARGRGCPAGESYCRITPEGLVTPCPYIPQAVGDLRKEGFVEIWRDSEGLNTLRRWELEGRCGICEFKSICGGCRARALASGGGLFAEDPWCAYQPGGYELKIMDKEEIEDIKWSEDAKERMERVPSFIRKMAMRRVEEYARSKGCKEITLEILKEVKERFASGPMANFRR